jgi:hypothetical protein
VPRRRDRGRAACTSFYSVLALVYLVFLAGIFRCSACPAGQIVVHGAAAVIYAFVAAYGRHRRNQIRRRTTAQGDRADPAPNCSSRSIAVLGSSLSGSAGGC